ncbi:MAG: DUF885 domain-containing protein [Steroidobacteraceae bacterium]
MNSASPASTPSRRLAGGALLALLAAAAAFAVATPAAAPAPAPMPAAAPAATTAPAGDAALARLADEYIDAYLFPTHPTFATHSGLHSYDSQLEDYSAAARQREIRTLRGYERRFGAVAPAGLSGHARGNRELLLGDVRSRLLALETVRMWEKDPNYYPTAITDSAYTIMQRSFAPPAERLRLLIARERAMPAALAAGRRALRNPPRIYTEIAIEQLDGIVRFFREDLPLAFRDAGDAALQAEFARSNGAVIAALEDYATWVKRELLPRSHGDFRLGAATFARKLRYDEMVDIPLDRLLAIGMADLRRNQAEFARIARELEPDKSTAQVLADLVADHPPPAQLLEAFRADFDGLIGFLDQHPIITVPSRVRPILQETPPFMRATTFASMDTPGPYEQQATEAYFFVTIPDAAWPAARTEGFMAQFSYSVISNVVVHEAYPGHYLQFLWMHQVDDRVRRLFGANSNAEGWAHYCEQMMLDEGYGQPGTGARDARQARLLRLGQLQDALLRDARFVVGLRMHTGDMSFEQGVKFFVDEGYQSREVGEVETKRGTQDPTYLYYTLGKLQLLKLRADLQARRGAAFNLREFHDDFMREGFPPLAIVRRALLGDDSPTL